MGSSGRKVLSVVGLVLLVVALQAVVTLLMLGPGRPGPRPEDEATPERRETLPEVRQVLMPVLQIDTARIADAVAERLEKETIEKLAPRIGALLAEAGKGTTAKAAPAKADHEAPDAAPRAKAPSNPTPKPAVAPAPKQPTIARGEPTKAGGTSGDFWPTDFGPQPALGKKDAAVVVFILSDFQCPVCRRAANGLAPLIDKYRDRVRWVFWNNPLAMHRRARPAAKAAMAAFRQGRFFEYHDKLFANSRQLEDADLDGYAKDLGLDMDKFHEDLADPALDALFDANSRVAELLGARGTPSFMIDGRKQVGWGSAGGIQAMVEKELKASAELLAEGRSVDEVRAMRGKANAKTPEEAAIYIDYMLKGHRPPASNE